VPFYIVFLFWLAEMALQYRIGQHGFEPGQIPNKEAGHSDRLLFGVVLAWTEASHLCS
jgi:hypothetical protein